MRLWSIHPRYLDPKGLVAVWREGLLALKVLKGKTQGYKNHPQLQRFKVCYDPVAAITGYLWYVHDESLSRGYSFDSGKLASRTRAPRLSVTTGQLAYELEHLKKKLAVRDRLWYERIANERTADPNPLFTVRPGAIEDWERPNGPTENG